MPKFIQKNIFVFIISLVSIKLNAQNNEPLKIAHLTGNFYIYTTYNYYKNTKVPANGMYVVTQNGVILFDTPWDSTQFKPLLDSIKTRHNKNVSICIATHWHSDRTIGLEYYKTQGIKTYTTALTDKLSKENNNKRAEFLMMQDTLFTIDEYNFEIYYPGAGHTLDNIVIWFNKERILYGGCLIKGAEATDLGFVGDGDVNAYETTLKKVKTRFSNPNYIIVSHHNWLNKNSLKHSIKLAKKLKNTTKKI